MKLRLIVIVSITAILCGNNIVCYAKERVERYSGLYLRLSEIPAAEGEFVSPDGTCYELRNSELEEFYVPEQTKQVESLIVYHAVGKFDSVPKTADIKVWDEESERTLSVLFPLLYTEYTNMRWKAFQFQMTIHEYDADLYMLNGLSINAESALAELTDRESDVLEMLRLSRTEIRNLKYKWAGEPYNDESGILCRKIEASGEQKVWDCKAGYGGEIDVPGYYQYRMRYSYGEKEAVTNIEIKNTLENENQEEKDFRDLMKARLLQAIKICLEVTVGIIFLMLAVIGFRFLRSYGRRIQRERDQRKEEREDDFG